MKVIKKGRSQKGWAEEFKCTGEGNGGGGCGAILLVEEKDLFQSYRSFMGRDEEWYATFKCSDCGVLTDANDAPFSPLDLPDRKKWEDKNWERND